MSVRFTTEGVVIQLYTQRVQEIFPVVIATGVPPLPIPNREVKPDRADGTAHPRESRSPPFYNKPRDSKETRGFVFSKVPFSFECGISLPKYLSQVLDQAKTCLEAPARPHNYRNRAAELIPRLSLQLRGVSREKPDLFHSGATDLPIVKRIKEIANRIIQQKHSQSYAWRIDVALFLSVMCSGYLGYRSSA